MQKKYFRLTNKARTDKVLNTLIGILEGIAADQKISTAEMQLLIEWVDNNQSLVDFHPYNELVPVVVQSLQDGKFTEDEHADLLFVCNNLKSTEYYDQVTADLQRLQGLMGAIASDGRITDTEANHLRTWIYENEHLRSCWPYDELESLLTSILSDHRIDQKEQKELINFFSQFSTTASIETPRTHISTLMGICSITPEIIFENHKFCVTGECSQCSRSNIEMIIFDRGGKVLQAPSPKLDYLIVGSNGNPCWSYACYGRKIEQVMNLRKNGARIMIVHENDFFDIL